MQRFAQGYLFFKFPQRRNVWNSWHFDVANAWYDGFKFLFPAYFFLFLSNYRICPLKRNIRPWAKCREIRQKTFTRSSTVPSPRYFFTEHDLHLPSKPPWTSSSNETLHSSSNPYHEEIPISHTFSYSSK